MRFCTCTTCGINMKITFRLDSPNLSYRSARCSLEPFEIQAHNSIRVTDVTKVKLLGAFCLGFVGHFYSFLVHMFKRCI